MSTIILVLWRREVYIRKRRNYYIGGRVSPMSPNLRESYTTMSPDLRQKWYTTYNICAHGSHLYHIYKHFQHQTSFTYATVFILAKSPKCSNQIHNLSYMNMAQTHAHTKEWSKHILQEFFNHTVQFNVRNTTSKIISSLSRDAFSTTVVFLALRCSMNHISFRFPMTEYDIRW